MGYHDVGNIQIRLNLDQDIINWVWYEYKWRITKCIYIFIYLFFRTKKEIVIWIILQQLDMMLHWLASSQCGTKTASTTRSSANPTADICRHVDPYCQLFGRTVNPPHRVPRRTQPKAVTVSSSCSPTFLYKGATATVPNNSRARLLPPPSDRHSPRVL